MNIIVTGRSVKVTPGIKNRVNELIEKHRKLLGEASKIQVELKQAKAHGGVDADLALEITVNMPKAIVRVEEKGSSFYTIVDLIDPIFRRRLIRYKEHRGRLEGVESWKVIERKKDEEEMKNIREDIYADGTYVTPEITRYKEYSQNYPMEPAEAIERMELLGHEAFLFKNVENNKYAMVYKKSDGTYGLVVPKDG